MFLEFCTIWLSIHGHLNLVSHSVQLHVKVLIFFSFHDAFSFEVICSNEAKQTTTFSIARYIQMDLHLICSFSMQSIQNLGLAVISQVAGKIVEGKGYLVLEVFFCAWLCSTCSNNLNRPYLHVQLHSLNCASVHLTKSSDNVMRYSFSQTR